MCQLTKIKDKLHGICVVLLFMTSRIWGMPGKHRTLDHLNLSIRTYVCSDIIKRILRDFFGYDVKVFLTYD